MAELTGKVVVVTGGASGIGRGIAEEAMALGANVVVSDVEQDALDAVARDLANGGGEVLAVRTDVTQLDQVELLRKESVERFGRVDMVFNNAGVAAPNLISDVSISDWRWVLDVNLWGVIHGVHAFLPLLIEQGSGHIINTASSAGLMPFPTMGTYVVSKYGIIGLSEVLYHEQSLQQTGVQVSVIIPGPTTSNLRFSARNRPDLSLDEQEALRQKERVEGEAGLGKTSEWQAISANDAAREVFAAVAENKFWILSHDEAIPGIVERSERLVSGQEPRLPDMLSGFRESLAP